MDEVKQAAFGKEGLNQLTDELPLEQYIAFRIHILSHALDRQMDKFLQGNYSLSFSDWRVISFLGQHGKASVGEIATQAQMDKGLISRIVTKLVKAKLVNSKPNPKDRRLVIVSHTKKGKELYETVQPQALKRQEALSKLFDEDERQVLYSALDKITVFASKEDIVGGG